MIFTLNYHVQIITKFLVDFFDWEIFKMIYFKEYFLCVNSYLDFVKNSFILRQILSECKKHVLVLLYESYTSTSPSHTK